MTTKYHNEVIKLNEDQTNEGQFSLRSETVLSLVKQRKNLLFVNQNDEQCFVSADDLLTKGKKIDNEEKGISHYLYSFTSNTQTLDRIDLLWLKRVHWSFYNLLGDYLRSDKFLSLITSINDLREDVNIFPAKEDVFKAFKTHFKSLRVIIVGQDPYPQAKSKATGLAFASYGKDNTVKPFALKQIEREIKEQMNYPANMYMDNDLEYLAKQGVMLLNSSLTVEEDSPGIHANKWFDFMHLVFQILDDHPRDLIFVFLGSQAQSFAQYINPIRHTIIKRSHPTSAYHQQLKSWDSKGLFKEISQLTQIRWI